MNIVCADILNTPVDALLLTIDGANRGMEGNLARQFEKRWPEDWHDMQRDIRYPIPLGRTVAVPWDGDCPWQCVLLASTLNHADILSDADKCAVVRSAFNEALVHCQRLGIKTLSTTVLRGGWRLSLEDAFRAMVHALAASSACSAGPTVQIFVKNEVERNSLVMLS